MNMKIPAARETTHTISTTIHNHSLAAYAKVMKSCLLNETFLDE